MPTDPTPEERAKLLRSVTFHGDPNCQGCLENVAKWFADAEAAAFKRGLEAGAQELDMASMVSSSTREISVLKRAAEHLRSLARAKDD